MGAARRSREDPHDALADLMEALWREDAEARRQIGDYLDDELEPPVEGRVERHLERCRTWLPPYAALVGTTTALKAPSRDPDSVVPPALAGRPAGLASRTP